VVVVMIVPPRCNEHRRGINHRSGLINYRCWLVNHRRLDHNVSHHRCGLRINNGRLLDHHLPNDRCGRVDRRS